MNKTSNNPWRTLTFDTTHYPTLRMRADCTRIVSSSADPTLADLVLALFVVLAAVLAVVLLLLTIFNVFICFRKASVVVYIMRLGYRRPQLKQITEI